MRNRLTVEVWEQMRRCLKKAPRKTNISYLLASLAFIAQLGVVLNVNKDVLAPIVWRHKAEALVCEELLNGTSGRHVSNLCNPLAKESLER